MPRGAKSRMRRTETPKPIWIKFCMVVDITDIVTHTNFGDHRLRFFLVAGGQISPSPIDFHRRSYNTLALPCERVMISLPQQRWWPGKNAVACLERIPPFQTTVFSAFWNRISSFCINFGGRGAPYGIRWTVSTCLLKTGVAYKLHRKTGCS